MAAALCGVLNTNVPQALIPIKLQEYCIGRL